MLIKMWGAFMCLYAAIALWGGIADGVFMTPTDTNALNNVVQGVVTTAPSSQNIVAKWLGASFGFLTGVVDILTLNFSMFDGAYLIVRVVLLAIASSPIWVGLLSAIFGRVL